MLDHDQEWSAADFDNEKIEMGSSIRIIFDVIGRSCNGQYRASLYLKKFYMK
jgi:hypothetical protein